MDINKLRSELMAFRGKERGGFIKLINEHTKYTYRHVHNFLTKENYNVTINFVQDMHDLIKGEK